MQEILQGIFISAICAFIATIIKTYIDKIYVERPVLIPLLKWQGMIGELVVKNFGKGIAKNIKMKVFLDNQLVLFEELNIIEPTYEKHWLIKEKEKYKGQDQYFSMQDIKERKYSELKVIIRWDYLFFNKTEYIYNLRKEMNMSLIDSAVESNKKLY